MRKVLIVTCRFDEDRMGGSRPWRVPQAMAAAFLAGGFNPKLCEIRLYSELYSGPLVDLDLLRWPDMLVLSGPQVDFDRFLHLTAYARTLNPKLIEIFELDGIPSLNQDEEQNPPVSTACDNAGIIYGQTKPGGITGHDLRHTFATRLRGQGVHELDIMQLMGHSSVGVTAGYAHAKPSVIQSAVNKLAEPRGEVVQFARKAG